jgi:hypothetical protein
MEQVLRFDEINLDQLKLTETPEGFLEGYAIATRTGVFSYRRADGSVQRELRTDEEVFSQDAIDSFKMKPITNNHPEDMVNIDNASELSVGMTGQEIKKIDNYLAPFIKITDKQAVQDAKSGKRGLSFGYKVTLVKKDGVFKGERYDYVQTNIRGNHLALVYEGRAGDKAKLRLDSQDAICVFNTNFNDNLNMKKIRLDGKEFEVSEEVASKIDSIEAENTELKKDKEDLSKDKSDLQTKLDTVTGERDSIQVKLDEELKKDHTADIAAKVQARIDLEKKASEFFKSDEDLSKLSDKEIKSKVITLFTKEFKADEVSEDYLTARFDSIIDIKKDANFAENIKAASNKTDSSQSPVAVSNADLQRDLIKNSTKKE